MEAGKSKLVIIMGTMDDSAELLTEEDMDVSLGLVSCTFEVRLKFKMSYK